jgi:pimeloyl-ACP methyl ester carboxylesterase
MSFVTPLLLLPGLLCDEAVWQNQINYLKDITNCSVADTTKHDTIKEIADDVLQAAPPQFALAGLSMGGYVALEIMRRAPERVLKLAFFDTTARADTPHQQERRRLLLAMSRSGQFKGVTPRLLPSLIHPDRVSDISLTKIIMEMAERVGREAFTHQLTAIINRIDSRPFLKDIQCPTLVVGGRQDVISAPELMQELAQGITGSEFHIIENCGHLSPLEHPETVNKLMRAWLVA